MSTVIDSAFAERQPALVLGLMSGTSLDGLDLCAARLQLGDEGDWTYDILAAESRPYPDSWRDSLHAAFAKTRLELEDLHQTYGRYLAEEVRGFCESRDLQVQLVASHGHTIHHRPQEGYTFQLGDGRVLSRESGLPVVSDFRVLDVALGGQGAPLVPIADRLIFGDFSQCLNLGGFANLSYESEAGRLAFDVTVINMLLNRLAAQLELPYDAEGRLARAGVVQPVLLQSLSQLRFYRKVGPKSLGREWFEQEVWPLFNKAEAKIEDLLATANSHIANMLAEAISQGPAGRVLVTGGGAYNSFLIERLRQNLGADHAIVLPEGQLIEQKEALAFALLGALRMRGEVNTLASVTGASRDSCGGSYFHETG